MLAPFKANRFAFKNWCLKYCNIIFSFFAKSFIYLTESTCCACINKYIEAENVFAGIRLAVTQIIISHKHLWWWVFGIACRVILVKAWLKLSADYTFQCVNCYGNKAAKQLKVFRGLQMRCDCSAIISKITLICPYFSLKQFIALDDEVMSSFRCFLQLTRFT